MKISANRKTIYEPCSIQDCDAAPDPSASAAARALRACLHKSRRAGASLSLEAAVSVPLFLLFSIVLISFLCVLNLQIHVHHAMEETARSMGRTAYLLSRADSAPASSGELDQETLSVLSVGLNPTAVKVRMLAEQSFRDLLNRSRVQGGSGGLYTFASSYEEASGILDLVVHYDYRFPWIPSSWGTVRFVQRCQSHVWTGKSLRQSSGDTDTDEVHTVYVTPNGTVYHTSADCHYLDLSIHEIASSAVSSARNAGGGRYHQCPLCAGAGTGGTVYITDYGDKWHTTLGCSGLKRTVIETDLSEVGNMHVCSKCGSAGHSTGGHR